MMRSMGSMRSWYPLVWLLLTTLVATGCNVTWPMRGPHAVGDPLGAMGGAALIYMPPVTDSIPADVVATASPDQLAAIYAPILVQGQQVAGEHTQTWAVENDMIGEPHLEIGPQGSPMTVIDTSRPTVYVLSDQRRLGQHVHTQLTYTMWYPAHPRTKQLDVEAARIDSGVLRITLGTDNRPILYETVLACGCYHKVFAEAWVEGAARQAHGPPLPKKIFAIERPVGMKIDWEVAGLVRSPSGVIVPPVQFVSAGDHRTVGLHSSVDLNVRDNRQHVRPYRLAPYDDLDRVPLGRTGQAATIFDAKNNHQVFGAERRLEDAIFMWIGTDDAGHPRRNDEILLHFDQSHWMDPDNYDRYLRLPPGVL